MSFGTVRTFKSKKALADAVKAEGADKILVRDTSLFDNRGTIKLSELAGSTAVVVGPDVYNKRDWYAQVKNVKGEIRVV